MARRTAWALTGELHAAGDFNKPATGKYQGSSSREQPAGVYTVGSCESLQRLIKWAIYQALALASTNEQLRP